jgi:Flp pilus assembly protein TadG
MLVAARDQAGNAAVEFALVIPVLATILFTIISFGVAFNNYLALTNGTASSARQFSISRVSATPYTSARNRFFSSAPTLTPANITVTYRVAGTACSSDAGCQAALSAAAGLASEVSATYPCKLVIIGFDFAPDCKLTSQTTERVQ